MGRYTEAGGKIMSVTAAAAPQAPGAIPYPDSDGQPMADNTLQFQWITTIKFGIEALFADDPNVFVAGDLLWYPVEGDNRTRQAPDVLVAFGSPKGYRGSYRQWEEGDIPPQIVFEILSPGNRPGEMVNKWRFYDRFGVEEYYQHDPEETGDFAGWLRSPTTGGLEAIDPIDGFVSPRLGVRFALSGPELVIYRPDGERFKTYLEIIAERDHEREERRRAEERAARLEERLRALGVDPNDI
jgi:Uma2 family endonuclease